MSSQCKDCGSTQWNYASLNAGSQCPRCLVDAVARLQARIKQQKAAFNEVQMAWAEATQERDRAVACLNDAIKWADKRVMTFRYFP